MHQTVTAWHTLAWGPTFSHYCTVAGNPKQHSEPKGNITESEKEPKEIVPGKGDGNWKQVPRVALSVKNHVESLRLDYAESCGNRCISLCLFSLTLFLPVLPGWLDCLCSGPIQQQASGAAFLAVTGQDVPVGGSESHAPWAAQPQCLQLGGLWPAAVTGGTEGLLENSAEGHQGLRTRRLAAVPLAPGQEHHLGATLVQWVTDRIHIVVPHAASRIWVHHERAVRFAVCISHYCQQGQHRKRCS